MLGWLRRTTLGVASRQPASSVGAIDGSAAIGRDAIHSPILNNPTFNISIIANAKGVPEAPLRAVLEKLGEKHVPEEEIPARLNAAADELVRLRADLARLRNDRPEFAAIRARAAGLIDLGDFDAARAVLREGREAARALREEISRSEAAFLADEARVNRLQLNTDAALENLTEASRLDPDNTWVWIHLGDLWLERGSLVEAEKAYAAALKAAVASGDDRDVAVVRNKIGDIERALGNLPAALKSFRDSHQILERRSVANSGNTECQRDLSVSHERIGDVLVAEGDRAGALQAYRAGLAIRETLARRDPGNTQWQRDLSVSHNKIGDVLVAEGDRAGALQAYRAGLAIAETLARRDPGNTEWQRDLSVSHNKIGDVLVAEGDRAGALQAYRAGLAIAETLARRDPGNTEWQRDLSVSHERIGDVLVAEDEREGALQAYRAGLAIHETLSRRDPGNTLWQRDLIVSCVKIADADPNAAPAMLARALDIARQLQASGKLAPVDAWMPDELARLLAEFTAK